MYTLTYYAIKHKSIRVGAIYLWLISVYNISTMPEVIGEDGSVYPQMEPEDHAAYPESFYDYALEHPEILPNYKGFAYDALDLIDRRPDELIVLEGRHGIGKTMRLIPDVLQLARTRGYKALGSISVVGGFEGQDVHVDGHEYMIRNILLSDIHSKTSRGYHLPEVDSHRQKLHELLRARFQVCEGPGLFIFDEAASTADSWPEVIKVINKDAQDNGVSLAVTQPRSFWKADSAVIAREQNRKLEVVTGKRVTTVSIPEAQVSLNAIPALLHALGIEASLVDKFAQNPNLRRLRVAEKIASDIILRRLGRDNDDDFIWDAAYIKSIVGIFNYREPSDQRSRLYKERQFASLGLSVEEVQEISNQFEENCD
jgi:hypothetical protein